MAQPPDAASPAAPGRLDEERPPFSVLLWQYRTGRGWTQEQLAERTGLSPRGIRALEQGERSKPYRHTVRLLADALDLTGDDRIRFEAAAREGTRPPAQVAANTGSALSTFLIADIRGYTRYTEEHGDEAAAHLATRLAELADEVAEQFGGEVIELRGDEALAVFASARHALRASVQLVSRFDEEIGSTLPVQLGIGLDAGEAVPVRGGYRGRALNLAARLSDLAGRGSIGESQVLCSETVMTLAGKMEGLRYVDRGAAQLKHLDRPIRVIQVGREEDLSSALPPVQQVPENPPTNLPDEPTSFIGREREIEQIVALLQTPHIRIVTLTGPGGTGKTRLALQVAGTLRHQYEDGVFLVSLASLADLALVPSAIAEALSVREEAGNELVQTLTSYLSEKHLLLVLDNVEHLLDASSIVACLLDACLELHILVTSRIPLHLMREHEYAVPPLAVPDLISRHDVATLCRHEAVALFIDRARAVKADFQVTQDNALAVAEICQRLDGLPLAIELAAARIKLFPPQALLQRLSPTLELLTGGARDRPLRQQTLRNTIEWSYALLTHREQRLFARLSVFTGGCTLDAAEAVCTPVGDPDLLDGLASLVDKSLVQQQGKEEARFGMLETVREYGLERLEESGEIERLRQQHATYYLALAEAVAPQLSGPRHAAGLRRLEAEADNVRAALTWLLDAGSGKAAHGEEAARLATALWRFWYEQGRWTEGRTWLRRALDAGEGAAAPVRARALNTAGIAALFQGEYKEGSALLTESLNLFRALGSKHGIASSLTYLGYVAAAEVDERRVRQFLAEALDLRPQLTHPSVIAYLVSFLGLGYASLGDLERGIAFLEESAGLFRQLGDDRGRRQCLAILGLTYLSTQDQRQSEALFRETLELSQRSRDVLVTYFVLFGLAGVARLGGQLERAVRLWGAADNLRHLHSLDLNLIARQAANYDVALASTREQLGETAFVAAWEEGCAMSLEEAVVYALDDITV